MRFWNRIFFYNKKQALEYLDSLERYLVRLKRAVYNKKNGLNFTVPQLEESVKFPEKSIFGGVRKKDFERAVSKLEIRISLEKSQLEKLEMG